MPEKIYLPEHLRETIQAMANQMAPNGERLEVTLTPSRIHEIAIRGGMIRTKESENPEWYQRFTADHPATRTVPRQKKHSDTRIKRKNVHKTLVTMLKVGWTISGYGQKLIAIAEQVKQDWEDEESRYAVMEEDDEVPF